MLGFVPQPNLQANKLGFVPQPNLQAIYYRGGQAGTSLIMQNLRKQVSLRKFPGRNKVTFGQLTCHQYTQGINFFTLWRYSP